MTQVFLSYSRKDFDTVHSLAERLRRRNYRVWMDKSEIQAGSNWQQAIHTAIKASSALVVVLSPHSLASEWVDIEFNEALDMKVKVIPYMLGAPMSDLPVRLKKIDAIDGNESDAFEKLINALPQEAHIHESALLDNGLIRDRKRTFAEAAEGLNEVIRPVAQLSSGSVELIGLPLSPTKYCMTYLVGLPDDTLEWRRRIQLGLQLTQSYPGDQFPAGIAQFLLEQDPPVKPHLLLVRGPLKINFNNRDKRYITNYGLDYAAQGEWQDAIEATQVALHAYHGNTQRPELQIFALAPTMTMYDLGSALRGFYQTEGYQYDMETQRYYRVSGNLA